MDLVVAHGVPCDRRDRAAVPREAIQHVTEVAEVTVGGGMFGADRDEHRCGGETGPHHGVSTSR